MKIINLSQLINRYALIICLFCLMTCCQCINIDNQSAQLLLSSLTTTNSTISTQAQYTLTILRITGTLVPIDSSLRLTFSNDYLGLVASTPTCSSVQPNLFRIISETQVYRVATREPPS